MRLALVATPALLSDQRAAPGALDGDLIRARLPLEDTGFRTIDLDPSRDLAEQLDQLLAEHTARGAPPGDDSTPAAILFYASTVVALSTEGELFLCVDPANPGVGDALADIAAVFGAHACGRVLFLIECHHPASPEDPFASATVVAAAKQAVSGQHPDISLLVAAHPIDTAHADMPSAFTRAFVEELDNGDLDLGLTAGAVYARIQESERLTGVVPCSAWARGQGAFPLFASGPGLEALDEDEAVRDAARSSLVEIAIATGMDLGSQPALPGEPTEVITSAEHDGEPASPEGAPEANAAGADTPHDADLSPHASEASPSAPETASSRAPDPSRISVLLDDEPVSSKALVASPTPPPRAPDPSRISVLLDDEPVSVTGPSVSPTPSAPPPKPSYSAPPGPSYSAPPPRASWSARPPAASRSVPPPAQGGSKPPSWAQALQASGGSVPPPGWSAPPVASPYGPAEQYLSEGERLIAEGDLDGALTEFKKALAVLGLGQKRERAEVHVRIAEVRWRQERRREAIAAFEKALQIIPEYRPALEALIVLNVDERDLRGLHAAEERFLAHVTGEDERFQHMIQFAERWQSLAEDAERARVYYERARAIRPDDLHVLRTLRRFYETAGAVDDAIATRRRIAEVTEEPSEKAREYFDLGKYLLDDLREEERGIRMLEVALESDPSLLEPLALIAKIFADRQEWGQLELAYRQMLGRVVRIPSASVRREVRWELSRRLGLLFRDHLEDPVSALSAFESALEARPDDMPTLLTAVDIARSAGRLDRAAAHLASAVVLEPADASLYHQLFELYQKLRRPDQAWAAASVTTDLGETEARERFVFEEHRPDGIPRFSRTLRATSWEHLFPADRERAVDAVLSAITDAAIEARLAQRTQSGTLPQLDPRTRQDPQQSTVSVVRSFAWASHLLGISAPAVYLREDAQLNLAAVIADHPAVIAGAGVLRGRSMPDLAFLIGSHLTYHVGAHRLLLSYPTIDELAGCFLAAVSLVRPTVPIPPALEEAARTLATELDTRVQGAERDRLQAAVLAFEEAGARADLAHWAGAVERCAARTGYLLSGDLAVAVRLIRAESTGLLAPEETIGDLYAFTVSDAFHALRTELGIAIQP
ncbi:hypothetical protein [Chondromyces apiculatus]|uniref:Uncharacterized protein n=1 Tax=Chondromyces apiculatus DSM 436 TaxID=1192034 RepID=A0A017TEV5_9BACT|nr:hypothetical protein [Chondromyces apiculatus]EYF07360.1 Hypothetical protein CAP_0113 [Chondromyces apiculatus DSM 436]